MAAPNAFPNTPSVVTTFGVMPIFTAALTPGSMTLYTRFCIPFLTIGYTDMFLSSFSFVFVVLVCARKALLH